MLSTTPAYFSATNARLTFIVGVSSPVSSPKGSASETIFWMSMSWVVWRQRWHRCRRLPNLLCARDLLYERLYVLTA